MNHLCCLLITLLSLTIFLLYDAEAKVIRVPTDYPTIQAGIDAANSGDVVSVAPGTYRENITLKNGVSVLGSGPQVTIIHGSGQGNVVTGADNAVIRFFKITGSGTSTQNNNGVYCNSTSPTITDNIITGNDHAGVYIFRSSPYVTNNIIENTSFQNIFCSGQGANPKIFNNLILSGGRGVAIYSGAQPEIINNTISVGWTGIQCGSSSPIIKNTIVVRCGAGGIQCYNAGMGPSNPSLSHNNFWENQIANYGDCERGNNDISHDPLFVTGPYGAYYLNQGSPCVDAGEGSASSLGLNLYTTRTDHQYDIGTVDMGFHYHITEVDLRITKIEINQAMFNTSLVAGKATVVRVYLESGSSQLLENVTAKLYLDGKPYEAENTGEYVLKPSIWDYDPDEILEAKNSLNFYFDNLDAGTHSFYAVVDPDNRISESDELNNRSAEFTETFYDRKPINIVYVPIEYAGQVPSFERRSTAHSFLRETYPVANSNIGYKSLGTEQFTGAPNVYSDLWLLLVNLSSRLFLYNASNDPDADFIVGYVPRDFLYTGYFKNSVGLINKTAGPSLLVEDRSEKMQVALAHEIGHHFDLYPAPNEEYIAYPLHGKMVGNGGFNVTQQRVIPLAFYNFMGNADTDKSWVDKETFTFIFDKNLPSSSLLLTKKSSPNEYLHICGIVSRDNQVTLLRSSVLTGELEASEFFQTGSYSLAFIDMNGVTINSYHFDLSFAHPFDPQLRVESAPFSIIVPFVKSSKKILLLHENVPMAEIQVSEHRPLISVITPNGGERLTGIQSITWSAHDEDGDSLSFSILYAANNLDWIPVATNLKDTNFVWNTDNTPGSSSGIIKVIANDGVNTLADQSDRTFSVQTKHPRAIIDIPIDGTKFVYNKPIKFIGSGIDLEDGALPENVLGWRSSIDGHLGSGESITVSTLSEGIHAITLTVQDAEMMTGSDTITIHVISDSDSDGMPDEWENQFSVLNPNRDDAREDLDNDDLSNFSEYYFKTDPTNPDTDGDGYKDGFEVKSGTNPNNPDSIPTRVELSLFGVTSKENHLLIFWKTSGEIDHTGFNLFRTLSANHNPKVIHKINGHLIVGKSPYAYMDKNVVTGVIYFYWLEEVGTNGQKTMFGPVSGTVVLPTTYALEQNYPNPFNARTTIKYQLPVKTKVSLKIYNVMGQEIRTLMDSEKEAGYYMEIWDGEDNQGLPAGSALYIYRIEANGYVNSKKLLLIK